MSGFQGKRRLSQSREPGLTIDGLSTRQVALLDRMWQFEELHELEAWQATLSAFDQQQVDLLIRLVLMAQIDDIMQSVQIDHDSDPYPDANDYLQRFRLQ